MGTSQATTAHYLRDALAMLLIFGSIIALAVWGIVRAREIPQEKPPVLKCPACGAELELRQVRERSKE